MPGTDSRRAFPGCKFVFRPNPDGTKTEVCFGLQINQIPSVDYIVAARWSWDDLFTVFIRQPVAGDEYGITKLTLQAHGLWDTIYSPAGWLTPQTHTWNQLYNGASFVDGVDGNTYSGFQAMDRLLNDYYVSDATWRIETTLEDVWNNTLIPTLQGYLDATINQTPEPLAPPPIPPPAVQFPPNAMGVIATSIGAWLAEDTRLTGTVQGSRIVVGEIPVPR